MIVSELILKREKEEKLLFSFAFKSASIYIVIDLLITYLLPFFK